MREFTIVLDDETVERLTAAASRRRLTVEAQAAELIGDGLIRREWARKEGLAYLLELRARQPDELLSEEEATELVRSEIEAMRAERRAAGRP